MSVPEKIINVLIAFVIGACIGYLFYGGKARLAFSKFMCDEEGDVNIVSIVVLIGIAVLLAVFFKGQIMDLLTNLFGTITEKANSAVSGE